MNKKLLSGGALLLAAMIWGMAVIVQKNGLEHIGPYWFSTLRMIASCILLLPMYLVTERMAREKRRATGPVDMIDYYGNVLTEEQRFRRAVVGGAWVGVLNIACSILQLVALQHMSAGKNAFLMALYVVMVPIFALFLKHVSPWYVWVGVVLATVGMFLLCMTDGSLGIGGPELLMLACAACAAICFHIADRFVNGINVILMVLVECAISAVLGLVLSILFEPLTLAAVREGLPAILYTAVLATAVAYCLQGYGQKETDPSIAAIIVSLESVFALVFGFLLLHEVMSPRELLGCALMFAATVITQLPSKSKSEQKEAEANAMQ